MRKYIGGIPGLRERGIKYTTQHLNRLEKRGKFPRRIKQGTQAKNSRFDWFEDEIALYQENPAAWIAAHAAQDNAA